MILVLDLGLREGRLARETPVHRFEPLINKSLVDKLTERPHDVGLVREIHRKVRPVPFAENTQPLESLALQVDIFFGIFPAFAADLDFAHARLLRAEHLIHLDLDRKPVAVPSGQIRSVEAQHRMRLDNDVFQDLVDRSPHVDGAVGIGGAIVKDVQGTAGARLTNPSVDIDSIPVFQHLRLPLGEVGLHAERSLRQVECILDLSHFRHHCSSKRKPP